MKISELITRLDELREVAGEDLEVAVASGSVAAFEEAVAEISWATPVEADQDDVRLWECREEDNTEQIVVVW